MGLSSLDYLVNSTSFVFADLTYSAAIVNPHLEEIQELDFFVNGTKINSDVNSDGIIIFNDEVYGSRIFSDCYGYVQISIVLYDGESNVISLISDYICVLVKRGNQNDSVRRMAEYFYKNNETLLYGDDVRPRDIAGLKESAHKSLESRIILMEKIVLCYEENFRYFKSNSRFKTKMSDSIDSFERLQFITNGTIQYIIQHPEQLKSVNYNSGIKYNSQYFQPQKTLISRVNYSYDIYENQVIVGFLKFMIEEIIKMEVIVNDTIKHIPKEQYEVDGYVTSSFFIYTSTLNILLKYSEDLDRLKRKFILLYGVYKKILDVKDLIITDSPKPTAILLSVPQYHQIYDTIVSWFSFGIFDLEKEKFMLSFLKVHTLYECYVLTKINEFLIKRDFTLFESLRFSYTFLSRTLYRNTACKNTFKFIRDNICITLYYQPVVYCDDRRVTNGIDLYRNNSISFSKDNENDYKGLYYVPDFVLKIENKGFINYVIIDAKFSTLNTVKKYQVPSLVFKYLFSISPIDENGSIVGLCIINGKSDLESDALSDIYDQSINPGKILPQSEILTLTENKYDNNDAHMTLLKALFDKYIFN